MPIKPLEHALADLFRHPLYGVVCYQGFEDPKQIAIRDGKWELHFVDPDELSDENISSDVISEFWKKVDPLIDPPPKKQPEA